MPFVPHCLVSSIVAPKYSSRWRLAISTSPAFVSSAMGPGMLSISRHDSRSSLSVRSLADDRMVEICLLLQILESDPGGQLNLTRRADRTEYSPYVVGESPSCIF